MANNSKWYLILVLGLVLVLTTCVVGCSSTHRDAIEYLSKMREWQDKWDSARPWDEYEQLENLIKELEAIETPRDPIPLTFDGQTVDYWAFSHHEEYIYAHRHWLAVEGHMNRMQELEEARYKAMGSDEIPSCVYPSEYGVSPEYKDACWLLDQVTVRLGFVECELLYWFVMYLPERK